MNTRLQKLSSCAIMLTLLGGTSYVHAAFDENLNSYTLDTIIVEADATKNKFGDTITEQSYYRTGGDVKVITREEIDKRHYMDVSEAIKRVPGVTFQNPGYRGGEYGFGSSYNNGVSINGDTRVLILVDGRRVDNAASARISSTSARGGKGTGVILDQVVNMENVDKIEVIKGPGASAYGADATGGVINIITRKGGAQNTGSIDVSTGSWDKHNYSMSYMGSAGKDNSWHYFVSANRMMSQDTKFKDGVTGDTGTLPGSKFDEEGVNLRIDKDFNDKQSLKIWYNYKEGKDGYPVTAPSTKYWNKDGYQNVMFKYIVGIVDENNKLIAKSPGAGDANIPGYRTIYNTRALYNFVNGFKHNDIDISYTFDKDKDMESFVRLYNQNHRYYTRGSQQFSVFGSGNGSGYADYASTFPDGTSDAGRTQWMDEHLAPFPGTADKETIKNWVSKYGDPNRISRYHDEKNRGIQFQYAKSIGVNDIIFNISYDKAKHYNINTTNNTQSVVERKSLYGYLQDKIHVTDKWDVTPSVRFSKYDSFSTTNADGTVTNNGGSVHSVTPSLSTQYMFDKSSSMYAAWTRVFRPLRSGDYTAVDGVFKTPLKDEKGDVFTFGFHKLFGRKTDLAMHYDFTRMSNAIATLPILDDLGEVKSTAVNAKETKKSFNITLDHKFDDHFMLSASYSHMKDKWNAKNGWILDPSWGYNNLDDINTAINNLRPENHYSLNLSYENGKLYTGLLANWYTGCNTKAFSSNRFLVLDWNLNYKVRKDMTAYVAITNLTNEAYETIYYSRNGVGAYAMPGRCIMAGIKYTF